MEDRFADMARDYDRMFPRDLGSDRRLLLGLFERHDVGTILDCACGTGIHLQMLSEDGFQVTGSDASEAMLDVARARLSRAGIKAQLFKSTWQDLPGNVPHGYDAVVCLGNSLTLVLDDSEVEDSLKGMFAVVNPGGILVVSIRNYGNDIRGQKRIKTIEPEPDTFLLSVLVPNNQRATHRFFLIAAGGNKPAMTCYEFEMNALDAERLARIAALAGIDEVHMYGDDDLSPFSAEKSDRIIMAAPRPEAG